MQLQLIPTYLYSQTVPFIGQFKSHPSDEEQDGG